MCNCIEDLDELLAQKNTKISAAIQFSKNGILSARQPIIMTEKINPKKKEGPVKLFPSYCPFCGEQMPEATDD